MTARPVLSPLDREMYMEYEAHETYWGLKGRRWDFFICAAPDHEHVALCVFDSRVAAEEHARSPDEPQIFLSTLERYGTMTPPWVHQVTLLPRVLEVSRDGPWKIIEAMRLDYAAVNPPSMGRKMKYFELRPSRMFRAE